MVAILRLIQPVQITFIPLILGFAGYLLYLVFKRDDKPAGLALYLGLTVVVDSYMVQGLFLPGLEKGSIKYSELLWCVLFIKDKELRQYFSSLITKRYFRLFLIFIFFMFIASFKSQTIQEGIFFFRRAIFPQILAFSIAITGFQKNEDYIRFFNYLSALLFLCALYIIWLRFLNVTIVRSPTMYTSQFARNIQQGRYGSFFGNPNYLGCFIILITPVYAILSLKKHTLRYLYLANILLLIFMLSQTGSRGPLICWIGALFVLGIIRIKKIYKLVPKVIALFFIFAIVMPGVVDTLTRRFDIEGIQEELQATETVGRGFVWQITAEMIASNPLGIGLGENNYLDAAIEHIRKNNYQVYGEFTLDNPHNSYLQIAIMGGLQCLIPFVMILLAFIRHSRRIYRKSDTDLFAGIFAGLIGYSVAMANEPVMLKPMVANLYWINLGLAISIIRSHFDANAESFIENTSLTLDQQNEKTHKTRQRGVA